MPAQGSFDNSYPALLETENKIQLLEPFKGAKAHHKMRCMVCNHVWEATPLSKRQTLKKNGVSGCPACNESKKQQKYAEHRSGVIETLYERGVEILDPNYDGRLRLDYSGRLGDEKILVKNRFCGHEFKVTPLNLIQSNISCSVCGVAKRITAATAWSKANSAKWQETAPEWEVYKAKVANLTKQIYTQHKTKINPKNLPRGKAGEEGCYHVDHKVPVRFCFDNNIPVEVCASVDNLQMLGWRENVGSRHHIKGSIPPSFFKYLTNTTKLQECVHKLQTIFPNGKPFVPIGETLSTLYDETSNIAVVVIPLDKQYGDLKIALHAKRSIEEQQVRCIQIFEDEFQKFDILKAKLQHYANVSTTTRLHARKLVIKLADKVDKQKLLNSSHIQGGDGATHNIGAYLGDKLVAVMTFTHPRIVLGQKQTTPRVGIWELSRFCVDVNYHIPGIASRLLKFFQQTVEWREIYSYADKRWSLGGLYSKLGFQQVGDTPPDYFYVIDGVRKHRWNYRKDVLSTKLPIFDPALSERENMTLNGFWRVWDCGSLKFSITKQ